MKRQKMRIICVFSILFIVLSAISIHADGLLELDDSIFTINTSEDENGIDVYENISPSLITSLLDIKIDDFEEENNNWHSAVTDNHTEIVDSLPNEPGYIFNGSGMLKLYCGAEKSRHTFRTGLNSKPIYAGDQNTFLAVLNTSEACTITVILSGVGVTLTRSIHLNESVYTALAMDVSSFSGKTALTEITIRVEFDDKDVKGDVYLDEVGFSKEKNIASVVHFMTKDYIAGGGNLALSDTSMTFLMASEGAYIETSALNYSFNDKVNAICVCLANLGSAESLTLYYATEETPQYKSVNSYTVELYLDSEIHYYIFPIRDHNITQIRLVFGENAIGLANIYEISPYRTYQHVTTDYGTLDSVEISDNKNDIIVRGTIDDEILEIYKDQTKPIALYCLDPGDDETNIITLATSKIAQTDLSKSFKFVIPIENTNYSRINCKFAVGITTENGITLIDDCMYITNPEILSEYSRNNTSTQTKKGIAADAYTADLLEADAYVEIDLTCVISDKETSLYIQTFSDTTYFNIAYITELDQIMKSYHDLGVAVTAKIYQSENSENNIYDMSIRENTVELFHAIQYLSRRYSGETNVISDYLIDTEAVLKGIEKTTIDGYIKNVSNYIRISYNAIMTVNSSVDFYFVIGSQWDKQIAYDAGYQFGARQTIDMIGSFLSAEGDILWNVAVNTENQTEYAFNISDAYDNFNSNMILVKNIAMLERYLSLNHNQYSETRKIIVIDSKSENNIKDDSDEVTEFIYSYFCVISEDCVNVERFIINYSAYGQQLKDTIQYIDTELYFEDYSQYALEQIDITEWSQLSIGKADQSKFRTVVKSGFMDKLAIVAMGSYELFDFSQFQTENEWNAYANCSLISTGNQSIERSAFLSASLIKDDDFSLSGIVCDYQYYMDFSAAPYLSMELQIAGDSLEIDEVDVSIIFYSDDQCIEFNGCIATSEWNNISLDLSGFKYNNRIDRIRIVVKNDDLPKNTTLMLCSMMAVSDQYTDEAIKEIMNASKFQIGQSSVDFTVIIILIMIIITSGSAVMLHLLSLNKKNK